MAHHLTRRTHHKIGAHAQGLFFLHKGIAISTTIHGNRTNRCKITEPLEMLGNLNRKFPGGHNHQGSDGVRIIFAR